MRLKDRLLQILAPPLAAALIRLLYLSIRVEFIGEESPRSLWQSDKQVILSFWHDQLLLMVLGYRGPKAKILISPSNDGELIARTMRWFGQDAVRGSSSRGGRSAFKSLITLGKEKVDLVITPDGPKGPRHELKDGVLQLARLTGRPVIPMAFVCSKGHRFASWDRFLLPFPFCRGVYAFGAPLRFDKAEGMEHFKVRLEQAMATNQERAMARLEDYGVSAV